MQYLNKDVYTGADLQGESAAAWNNALAGRSTLAGSVLEDVTASISVIACSNESLYLTHVGRSGHEGVGFILTDISFILWASISRR